MLARGANVPGLQGVCWVLPVDAKKPTSVVVHWSALLRSVRCEYEPSLHGSGADAPSAQYEPGTHTWHSVMPDSFMNLPAPHLSHVGRLPSGCTVPVLHGVGPVLPVGA